jgi:glycerol-3-phosphate acyltransferase PlsY
MNLLALFIGYFSGSFQTSYILGRVYRKMVIRNLGSGNAGTSNMVQTFGWKLGVLTFLGDILKVIIPLVIAKQFFHTAPLFNLILGIGGILGHNFPFYMGFKGGKGTATTLGMLLVFDYKVCILIALVLIAVVVLTDYIALASLISVAAIPIVLYLFKYNMDLIAVSSVMPVVCILVHRSNIKNMIGKNEKKVSSVFKRKHINKS